MSDDMPYDTMDPDYGSADIDGHFDSLIADDGGVGHLDTAPTDTDTGYVDDTDTGGYVETAYVSGHPDDSI